MFAELLDAARFFALKDGFNDTPLPGVWILRESERSSKSTPKFSRPLVALTLQGRKRLAIAGVLHDVGPGSLIIHLTSLPTECFVEEADTYRPFYSIVTTLDHPLVASLLLRSGQKEVPARQSPAPVMQGEDDDLALASFWQFVKLARDLNPVLIPMVMPVLTEALHAALLCGRYGDWLAALQAEDSYGNRLTRVIGFMQEQFHRDISIESLAGYIAMSPASFYRHFKLFTGYSHNQYLKKLRLHKASQLLLSTGNTVESVANAVGYKSCSQFCTDFKRLYNANASTFRTTARA